MSTQVNIQELDSKYTKVRSLYEQLIRELDSISKDAEAIEREIDQALDKEKMHDILLHIKDLPE